VADLVERVARHTGVRTRLLRKRGETQTWMEVYEGVTDISSFESFLRAAVADAGIEQLLVGTRHIECFED
jgi:hypothetical protein